MSRGRDSNRIHPECKTEELLERTFSMTWILAGNLEIKASCDKGNGFQAFTAVYWSSLVWFVALRRLVCWAANLRRSSTRKSEDVNTKAYGAPTVFTCTFITQKQAI